MTLQIELMHLQIELSIFCSPCFHQGEQENCCTVHRAQSIANEKKTVETSLLFNAHCENTVRTDGALLKEF